MYSLLRVSLYDNVHVINHIHTEVIYTKYEIATTTQNSLDITIRWLNCLENSLLIVFWKE